MNKKKIIIIAVVLLAIGFAVGGFFYWKSKTNAGINALEKIGNTVDRITDSAAKGTLPSLQTNPLENKPDLNPADKANPYKDIKTNPFE